MPIRTTIQRHRAQWVLNALEQVKPESPASRRFVTWIAQNHSNLGINLPKGFTVEETPKKGKSEILAILGEEDFVDGTLKQKRIERYGAIRDTLEKNLKAIRNSSTLAETALEKNLSLLSSRINLSPEEHNTLLFFLDSRTNKFKDAIGALRNEFNLDEYFEKAASFLGISATALKTRLSKESVLRNFIFYAHDSGNYYHDKVAIDYIGNGVYRPDDAFIDAISEPSSTADSIISRLLGPTPTTHLTLNDFAYLGKDRVDYLVETLRGMVEGNGHARKNSSLYGVPGVGKTELTAVIAQHLGVPLYAIGLSHLDDKNALSDSAKEPSRQDRLLSWRRAAFLVKAAHIKCLFLFDEADDILRDPNEDKNSNRASKAYLNWLLDNNSVPTIFVTNDVKKFQESTVRRILPTLHVIGAPVAVQAKILFSYSKQYGLDITEQQAHLLAKEFSELTSGVIETILYKTARRIDIKGNSEAQFKAIKIGFFESSAALNRGSTPLPPVKATLEGFDPKLISAQLDFPALADDFARARSLQGLSICLYGPQGAGKKTTFEYLASKLNMDTRFFSFNALYGPSGFSTETVVGVLEEALHENVFIVFNDAASLLEGSEGQRLDSHPFFRAIKGHPLPIGLTLPDIDIFEDISPKHYQGLIWRLTGQFTFAAGISGLDKEGQRIALEKIVGLDSESVDSVMSRISDVVPLVVGDFVRVAKQMKFRPSLAGNPDAVFEALHHNAMQAGHLSLGSSSGF